ncbi:hypothetical protein [Streptomyces sp. NPDC093149]|uniref:hypothetical protein n=1 Tax=Streptomyces sp. NPDC093149 TaxID=3366031 RepID=UPI003829AF41
MGYVVLPEGIPDRAAKDAAALVRDEPGRLRPVWRDPHWRVHRVEDVTPMVSGACSSVVRGDGAGLVVRTRAPGSVILCVACSPLAPGRHRLRGAGGRVDPAEGAGGR